ncbi:unnamed protein product [Adineta ricciae]|uniref:Magnesium transporter protein 1 n=1 Tax=Adineta ricciae TaxID=249248 RepID=A0A813P9N7_ADIRI|nr:unnamed protein product [Adineta ricciae]
MNYLLWLCFLWTCTIVNVLHADNNLADKVQQLTDWSSKNSLIRLNSERFKHFVRTPPRNYSMIIMLTALSPQRQCGVCKHAHDEFQVVAQSYRYSKAFSNKLFFAMVDFDEGAEVFQYLKLNSAPVFIHFPPKTKPKKGDQLDLNRRGFSADHLAKWVQDRTEIRIEIYRPPDYSGVLIGGFALAMIAGLLYLKRDSLSFLYNNLIWGIIVILAILTFVSGQMWNNIHGSTFANHDQKTGHTHRKYDRKKENAEALWRLLVLLLSSRYLAIFFLFFDQNITVIHTVFCSNNTVRVINIIHAAWSSYSIRSLLH